MLYEHPDVRRWEKTAKMVTNTGPTLKRAGIRALLAEAEGAASYAAHYWAATERRPGLVLAAGIMGNDVVDELQSLVRAARALDVALRIPPERHARKALLAEARALCRDLDAACGFIVGERGDEQLRGALRALRKRLGAGSVARLAIALSDLATLADELGDDLAILGVAKESVPRARELSQALAALGDPRAERRPQRQLRNQLLTLADQRISTICAAARFVFRDHPDALAAGRRRAFRGD